MICNSGLAIFDLNGRGENRSVVDVIKLFGENLDFPKIKKLNKACSNTEPAQKCENYERYF